MSKSSNNVKICIAVAIIVGTIGWLAFTGYGANKSYYVTIAELGEWATRPSTPICASRVS